MAQNLISFDDHNNLTGALQNQPLQQHDLIICAGSFSDFKSDEHDLNIRIEIYTICEEQKVIPTKQSTIQLGGLMGPTGWVGPLPFCTTSWAK